MVARKWFINKKFETHGIVKTKKSAMTIARNLKEQTTVHNTKVVKLSKPKGDFKYKVLVKERRRTK